ncbi:hypothetical protein [Bradyrhizobium sp. CW4]|nr:hypothetical protein [Bradyrhizobium sp. CW4]
MRKTRIGVSRIKMVFDQVEELGGSRQARCWRHGVGGEHHATDAAVL